MGLTDILKYLIHSYLPKNQTEQIPVLNKEEEQEAISRGYVEWWADVYDRGIFKGPRNVLANLQLNDFSLIGIIWDESGCGSGFGEFLDPKYLSKEDKRYYDRLVKYFQIQEKDSVQ